MSTRRQSTVAAASTRLHLDQAYADQSAAAHSILEDSQPSKRVRAILLKHLHAMSPGDSLPTYEQIAAQCACSIAPVRKAMEQLAREGRVDLQRGRPARLQVTNSFSRSSSSTGRKPDNRVFLAAYRPLESHEAGVGHELGVPSGAPCLVLGRVRLADSAPVALHMTYINPAAISNPKRFFLDFDAGQGSLCEFYAQIPAEPRRITAFLFAGAAEAQEVSLLLLPEGAPVMRARQITVAEIAGKVIPLEVMHATYTRAIEYEVERIPRFDARQA